MEYRKIQYFLAVARHMNFSAAARQMNISPQALTKQIQLMEQDLGMKLFIRDTRKVTLTKEGKICLEKLQRLADIYEATLLEITELNKPALQPVRIGIFSALPKKQIIDPVVDTLKKVCGKNTCDIHLMDMKTLETSVKDGQIDLGITYWDEAMYDEALQVVSLMSVEAKILVSRNHSWKNKKKIAREDLEQMPFLALTSTLSSRKGIYYSDPICSKRITVPNFETMLAYLDMGDAYAVCPESFREAYSMDYLFFDLPFRPFKFFANCIYQKKSPRKIVIQAAQALKDTIK